MCAVKALSNATESPRKNYFLGVSLAHLAEVNVSRWTRRARTAVRQGPAPEARARSGRVALSRRGERDAEGSGKSASGKSACGKARFPRRDSGAGEDGPAAYHRVDDAVMLEDHREAVVVPAGNWRLLWRAATDRGMTCDWGAEVLFDIVHGEPTLRTIDLRVAHLHLIVHHDGFGNCGTRQRTTAQQCGEDAGLHATTLLETRCDYNTAQNLSKTSPWTARQFV